MPIVNIDLANYFISVATGFVLFLNSGAARRSQLALHKKLDELIIATDKAHNDIVEAEKLSETEIAAINCRDKNNSQ